MSLKCIQVVESLAPESGGPAYTVPALARAIATGPAKVRMTVRTLAGAPVSCSGQVEYVNHAVSRLPFAKLLGASTSLSLALRGDVRDRDTVLHANGLWQMTSIYPGAIKRRLGDAVALVHSPRGMLGREALRISAWKKRPFWWLLQRAALEAADCLHATADSEFEEIRAAGLANPVAIIPNGIHLPELKQLSHTIRRRRTILSLGRVHRKKGLDRLVRAWAVLESTFPEWRLRILGPAEDRHDEELRSLVHELSLDRVEIGGAVYGKEKWHAFRQSDLFVLPTLNENFAVTVAEALAAELPVVATKGAPWSGLDANDCGWWIDHGVEPLSRALREAMERPAEQLKQMGERGRSWMARDFSWDRIGAEMLAVYQWLKAGNDPPNTVRIK